MKTIVNAEVDIRDFYNVEQMIKKFSKKVRKQGIIDDILKKRYFKSKSDKRREVRSRAKYIRKIEKNNEAKKRSNKS